MFTDATQPIVRMPDKNVVMIKIITSITMMLLLMVKVIIMMINDDDKKFNINQHLENINTTSLLPRKESGT